MKNKRREFLTNVCPSVALAFMGVTMLEACSSGGDDSNLGNNGNSGGNNNNGYTVSGNTVVIDLSHSAFASLNNNGWMNFTAQGMLLLKIDASTYRAFTNSCPHQGIRTNWTYNSSQDKFKCGQHNNSYPTDCDSSSGTTSNGTSGDPLKCFNTSFSGGKLTVTT
jgi:nitrite reductase/ring-hydroxylating ferredoxin subunit